MRSYDGAFIVPVRNDAANLRRCLHSIAGASHDRSVQVVVADNGSADDSPAAAASHGATVLPLAGLPVSALRNQGVRHTPARIVAFVDADHQIAGGWLDAAAETLTDANVGAVGAPYLSPPRPTWVQRIYAAFRSHAPGVTDVSWLGAGNMAMRHEVFEKIGGFDESLEACEDVDLCNRLRRAGYRVVSDSRMQSIHYGDPATLGALFRSELWRGRDNLRVTLRGPLGPRDLPSLFIPLLDLAALAAIVLGIAVPGWRAMASAGAAVFLTLAALRASLLLARLESPMPSDAFRAFAVACTYDAARALALVFRARHRRARAGKPAGTAA